MSDSCCSDENESCCGGPLPIARRDFIRVVGLSAATLFAGSMPVMAGPFETDEFLKLIPADKKLTPEWVKALFDRGSRAVWRGDNLKYAGMAIGGLCAGQLYLGGDGKLWYWDIFNKYIFTGYAAPTYAAPRIPSSPIEQGFTLKIADKSWPLEKSGFSDIAFTGEYPFGFVEYRDPACPVEVSLEAFSPFTPLSADDSSYPATVMRYTLRNTSAAPVTLELTGHLENGAGVHSRYLYGNKGDWQNRVVREGALLQLACGIKPKEAAAPTAAPRPKIVFADFEGADYGGWTAEGNAFEKSPTTQPADPKFQRVANVQGKAFANSFTGPTSDDAQGTLTSPEFTVERSYINFLIAGGNKPGLVGINLLVDGTIVRTATPVEDSEKLDWQGWDVGEYEGRKARIEIFDRAKGPWGHIEIDQIQFEDTSTMPPYVADMFDFGSMSLALLEAGADDSAAADRQTGAPSADGPVNAARKMIGAITRKVTIPPGQSHTATFVIAWHFPNLGHGQHNPQFKNSEGRFYATKFTDASAVAKSISDNFERLHGQTKLWHETWYDSTLPHWFLDRTFINISTLATSTAYHFRDGQFYGWEGVGCCGGTCTHVWSYEQAMGRLFPEYDRLLRDRMEYKLGAGLKPDGEIGNRSGGDAATDGHAGTILRTYRDHQTSPDDAFLKRNWDHIKMAIGWLIAQDGNNDGLIEGAQPNTLDEAWYGAVPWMSGLYLGALRAGEEMAQDMGDADFAKKCRSIFDTGREKFVKTLWNEEAGYFIQTRDPAHAKVHGAYDGCEIDQLYGQSWACQVGLGRIVPEDKSRRALASLWKYNFAPDVGPYAKVYGGQAYALAGEAGMLICTWPQVEKKTDDCNYSTLIFAGMEHQVAGHMIWEGMLTEGFAMERAIHDRYHPSKRNAWNEVECGDHYARSMASYGAFIAACGFEYHGPRGTMAFAPRLTPENFRSAFTAAEGWGTFTQKAEGSVQHATLELKWGQLNLKELTLTPVHTQTKEIRTVKIDGQPVPFTSHPREGRLVAEFHEPLALKPQSRLELVLG